MAKKTINVGSDPRDGTGDDLRTGGIKINENFDELYGNISSDTLSDSDSFTFIKTVGSVIKKITWSNLKSSLKSFFDTTYEPKITKNTAFNKDFGTGISNVARGNHNHNGQYIATESDPVFEEWRNTMTGFGAKKTGVDAGYLGQESIDDDYLYKCVVEGEAGVAVWKKSLMFQT